MNYLFTVCGMHRIKFDTTIKLLLQSIQESDYRINISSFRPENKVSCIKLIIKVTGSSKHGFTKVLVDFDNCYTGEKQDINISPTTLCINYKTNALHYWAVLGKVISIMEDSTPAYIAGYLIKKNMNEELQAFRAFSN